MGTTNSTKHELNSYLMGIYDNSGVQELKVINTGNMDRKKGLPVYNDTYTLTTTTGYAGPADINVKLANWNEAMWAKGHVVSDCPGRFNDDLKKIVEDREYFIYGHPDKWLYDYQQDYNNCGVDSSLNVLAMAGKKDIIEASASYVQYLSTPIVTKKNQIVWDEKTGTWKDEEIITETYPKAAVETEDEFLLWAVQNSKNDTEWYETVYKDNIPIDGDIPVDENAEINDFVVHSKNFDEYSTIKDIQETPLELGGTTYIHRDNILNYWGVDSTYGNLLVDIVDHVSTDPVVTTQAPIVNSDGTTTIKTTTTQSDELGRKVTVKTVTVKKRTGEDLADIDNWEVLETEEVVEVTYALNTDYFKYTNTLSALVQTGRGVILSGFANNFNGEKGGAHAISLVGVCYSSEETYKVIDRKVTATGAEPVEEHSEETLQDIVGFYVVDTGGFLTNGLETERAQFVDCLTLYNFLTDQTYDAEGSYPSKINFTIEEIRSWADNLNIVGNNRKNLLEGNEAQNRIYGGKGNDIIHGAGGNDYLFGDQNEDIIYGGQGNDVLSGGSGNDTYIFEGSDFEEKYKNADAELAKGSHDYIITGSGKDNIQFDNVNVYDSTENLLKEYTIVDSDNVDEMREILQNDVKYQNHNGNLVIKYTIKEKSYDTNNDGVVDTTTPEISYNNNTITIENYFKKQLYGSINDIILSTSEYSLEYAFNFIQDILSRGYVDYFTYQNKNNKINGSKFMDSIIGGMKNDSITSGAANDIINGGGSNDTIKGGAGDDIIYGSYGNDKIYGDSGDDKIKYQSTAGEKDNANAFAGSAYGGHDTLYSGSGRDTIELKEYTKDELMFTRAKNDLVITYGENKNNSITIASYFSKKGKTSYYDLVLKDGVGISLRSTEGYNEILGKTQSIAGTDGYDLVKGSGSLVGGLGHDTIKGGSGNDTLNGGIGSDKLYGYGGENTYVFDSRALGEDTIYTSGKGKSIIDFTGSDVIFTSKGANDAIVGYNDYGFTKDKNDLLINYARNNVGLADTDNALIRISNFFKSKGAFEILNADGTTLNIKEAATIYMNGNDEGKNKITGSIYNDSIIGYDYNDTLNGGKGNDTIVGGKGNDVITGGADKNLIKYANGDGFDTITLTKGEDLSVELSGFNINTEKDAKTQIFDYTIVKNNLVISYIDENGKKTDILNFKSLGSKDVTGATGSVKLYLEGQSEPLMDLRNGNYLDKYTDFSLKKNKYTGKWQAEDIDARKLNKESSSIANNKGAKINGKGGNDTIYGSTWNDTLDGGDGDDHIYSGYGKNTVNGGKGSDTYYIFEDDSNLQGKEDTTIKDTGKATDGTDIAKIYVKSIDDIKATNSFDGTDGNIWFTVSAAGRKQPTSITFHVNDGNGNKAKITGVEEIVAVERKYTDGVETLTNHTYNYESIVNDVANWLSANGYKDSAQVINGDDTYARNELLALFATGFDTSTP